MTNNNCIWNTTCLSDACYCEYYATDFNPTRTDDLYEYRTEFFESLAEFYDAELDNYEGFLY